MNSGKHTEEFDTRDARYSCMYVGFVVEVPETDPLGRIRVNIPGLLEPESVWAMPIGRLLDKDNGFHCQPSVGATVCIWFNQGDVDHPYWLPGPWGEPQGVSDNPEQSESGHRDVQTIRWRDFVMVLDGRDGQSKMSIEDLTSGTRIEVDRQSGDLIEEVSGSRATTIQSDLTTDVVQGDERKSILAGSRTEVVAQDDTLSVLTGNKTETVLLGSSTEAIPAGTKNVVAGLGVNITAGGAVNVIGGGAVSVVGSSVNVQSLGAGTSAAAGLQTNNFLGGIQDNIVGNIIRSVTGAVAWTISGALSFASSAITLGQGPHRRLLTEDAATLFLNTHTHAGPGAPPTQQIGDAPGQIPFSLVSTAHTKAS